MSYYSVAPILMNGVSMVTLTPGVNDPETGTVTEVGNEKYIFVYNGGNSQASPGFGVTCSATTNYTVTVSTTTNLDVIVGVVKHATLTTGAYGWVMTRGFCSVKAPASSGITVGDLLTIGGDGVFSTKSLSTGLPSPTYGKAMSTTASAGVSNAYIHIF